MIINWLFSLRVNKYFPKESTLASSSAASTSSNTTNGTDLTFNIANNKLIAVNVFSPPDKRAKELSFLPGGIASISIPVFNKSEVFDVTGAGDTVTAVYSLALASGVDPVYSAIDRKSTRLNSSH